MPPSFFFSTSSVYPRQTWPFFVHVEQTGFSPAHRVFRLRHVKHLARMSLETRSYYARLVNGGAMQ